MDAAIGRSAFTRRAPPPIGWAASGLVAFVIGSALAAIAGDQQPVDARRATAVVTIRAPQGDSSARRPELVAPELETLRKEIVSEVNLARALARCSRVSQAPTPSDRESLVGILVARLGPRLAIGVNQTPSPREIRVSVGCDDDDPRLAVETVNALAQQYADGCRHRLQADAQRVCAQARAATEQARSQFLAASAALESFLDAQLRAESAGAAVAQSNRGDSSAASAAAEPTEMVDNPELIRLIQQLTELRWRRSQLLTVRTPAHPEVQRIDADIAELERTAATAPRQIAQKRSALPMVVPAPGNHKPSAPQPSTIVNPSVTAMTESPPRPAVHAVDNAATAKYAALRAAASSALQQLDSAAQADRAACAASSALPSVELTLAAESSAAVASSATTAAGSGPFSGWVWSTLAATMVIACGVGMVVIGTRPEPTLTTLGEVRQALPVPVVGVIEQTNLPQEPDAGRRVRSSRAWINLGLVLIVAAAALLLLTLIGLPSGAGGAAVPNG